MSGTTYRAAYFTSSDGQGEIVLTGPEHASLTDEQLVAEAIAEARRADILGDLTDEQIAERLTIGGWTGDEVVEEEPETAPALYTHQVQTSDGRIIDGTHHRSQAEAVASVAAYYGWVDPIESDSYRGTPPDLADDEDGQATEAVSVYETQAECDADQDGSDAPRVVELLHPLADVER